MTNPEKRREALQLVRHTGGIEAERRLRLMLERNDAVEKRAALVALLEQLTAAFESGCITEVAAIYKQALSAATIPHKACLQRLVLHRLMYLFGPQVMLMSSHMTEREIKGYDMLWEFQNYDGE